MSPATSPETSAIKLRQQLTGKKALAGTKANGAATHAQDTSAFVFGATSLTASANAGTGTLLLAGSGAWTAVSNAAWLHIPSSLASGQGSAEITFTYDANPSAAPQTGTLTVAGAAITVTQVGANDVTGTLFNPLVSGNLSSPAGIAVDAAGDLYIADTGNSAIEEWTAGAQQFSVLVPPGALLNPAGLAVDPQGNVYIADTGNGAVEEWSPATQQLTLLATGLASPTGVAVDFQGNVYIAVQGANTVLEWNAGSQQLVALVSSGLNGPTGVAVDLLGNVYIADAGNNAVEQWTAASQTLNALATGLSNPAGVTVDGQGNVFVADAGSSSFKEWNAGSQQLTTLPFKGLAGAKGVAVDGVGNLYAADTGNNSVEQLVLAFIGPVNLTEGPAAGTDTFHVLPAATALSASTDQTWLTLTGAAGGVAGLAFSSNFSVTGRTAHVNVLGQQLTVTQPADTPAAITRTSGDAQSALGAQAFASPLAVVVADAAGNPIEGASVVFQINAANSGGSATFAAGGQMVTSGTGTVITPALVSNGIPGTFTVTASAGTLTSTFTLTNAAASLSTSSTLTGSGPGASSTFLNVSTPNAPWTAVSNASWIHIGPGSGSGTGSGSIQFTLDPNLNAGPQTGTITVAGETFTIVQAGAGSVSTEVINSLLSTGLDLPFALASDAQGNLYFADTGHNSIQKWTAATGQLTPVVTSGLNAPHGVAVDTAGNIYIADAYNNAVKEWIAASGIVTTLTGSGLKFPLSVAVDGQGNVYIADFGNNAVKRWNPLNQQVTTLIGAGLNAPTGVAVDGAGNVYVSDFLNSAIKQWSPATQQVVSLVPTGLNLPNALTLDNQGNLFIVDGNNNALKRWSPATQQTTTLISNGIAGSFGVATDSQGNFYLATPGNNSIQKVSTAYVTVANASRNEPAQAGSDAVGFQVLPAGSTVSISADQSWVTPGAPSGAGIGFSFGANTSTAARTAHLIVAGQPVAILQNGDVAASITKTMGDLQTVFVGQGFATPLRASVFDASGVPVQGALVVFTIVPGVSGAAGTFLVNGAPVASATISSDGNGNVVAPAMTANGSAGSFSVTASVNAVSVSYSAAVVAGSLGSISTVVGATAGSSSLLLAVSSGWSASANAAWLHLSASSLSGAGNATLVFNYDANSSAASRTGTITVAGAKFTVVQIGTSYQVLSGLTTLIGTGLKSPECDAVDAAGNVYLADTANNAVKEWNAATHVVTSLVSSGLSGPAAVAVDSHGNVYISDSGNNAVKEWSPSTNVTTTLIAAGLSHPYGIAVDPAGNVYVADNGHNAIKKWSAAAGLITLVSTNIGAPRGVALDLFGNLYFNDTKNNAIKEYVAAGGTVNTLVGTGLNVPSAVAVDPQGNVYFADTNNNLVKVWSPASLQVTSLATPGLRGPGGVALDSLGNVYIVDTGNSALKELSFADLSLGYTTRTEPAAAGSDSVTVSYYPASLALSPTSDQGWLTVTGVSNGVVSFNFALNNTMTARTGHIYILSQPVTITQSADVSVSIVKSAGNGQSVAVNVVYPVALQAQVKDAGGIGITGASVTFSVVAGANGATATFAGGVSTATVTTIASGLGNAPALTAKAIAGTFTVKAVAGNATAVYNLTITSH